MSAVELRMRPEYGPTLGRLLAPRWRASSRSLRAAVVAAGVGALLLVVAVALTLENAHYSRGGSVPFAFSYRGLYRVAPDPGGYVKIQSRYPDGSLKYSYAVASLKVPAYAGNISGELPVFATLYIAGLRRRYPDLVLRGEGKTRVNTVPGYHVLYTAGVDGRQMLGRDVLLLPPRPAVREGVAIEMLTSPTATAQVKAPNEVASAGVLLRPLKTFTFG
jgi:hypothetical protein